MEWDTRQLEQRNLFRIKLQPLPSNIILNFNIFSHILHYAFLCLTSPDFLNFSKTICDRPNLTASQKELLRFFPLGFLTPHIKEKYESHLQLLSLENSLATILNLNRFLHPHVVILWDLNSPKASILTDFHASMPPFQLGWTYVKCASKPHFYSNLLPLLIPRHLTFWSTKLFPWRLYVNADTILPLPKKGIKFLLNNLYNFFLEG